MQAKHNQARNPPERITNIDDKTTHANTSNQKLHMISCQDEHLYDYMSIATTTNSISQELVKRLKIHQ